MAAEFETSVDQGIKLSKRIYYGKDSSAPVVPPELVREMSRSSMKSSTGGYDQMQSYLPTAVMVYAVVTEPEAVDNPDVPSYQPYVHGCCDPPALIPLHMYGVEMEVDCCLDYARVSVGGRWRVHCLKGGRTCDCRVAVPMGEKGTILSVEVEVSGRLYHSQLMTADDAEEFAKSSKGSSGDGLFLKGSIYTFRIPQVAGGSIVSVKVSWSQKLVYQRGQFILDVPFSFPVFVNPPSIIKTSKREKILLNVSSGFRKEINCTCSSHALKELRREVGKMGFFYEAEVKTWSISNFIFSYSVCSEDLFGGVLLQSPYLRDFEERQMFFLHLFPGINQARKVFRREVIFLVDISGSMKGDPLENTKSAISSSLYKLNEEDSFNIIAFNGEMHLFSSLMEPATQETVTEANRWLNDTLIAEGGTNILPPLKQAMKLLAETTNSIPLIFLITDGAVEDERDICQFVKASITNANGGSISPRICTFGIGAYCNHYFLQMLAQIAKGHFDSASDADSVDSRLQRLFTTASSVIMANVSMDCLEHLDSLELLPCSVPDLTAGTPLMVSGRCDGVFPDLVKVTGTWADMTNFTMEIKVERTKDLPLDRALARRQIDLLTATAWLSQDKDLEEKVAKMSIQKGVPSEYTRMVLIHTDKGEKPPETHMLTEVFTKLNSIGRTSEAVDINIFLGSLGIGFGNLTATARNTPPGIDEKKPPDAAEKLAKAAARCCGRVMDRICCLCFINACSHTSKQCSIVFSQICAALACFECISCCYELCACE
ncbi:Inter-alpha-trypsin inhibitor heavy chain H3 [Linum perenne]